MKYRLAAAVLLSFFVQGSSCIDGNTVLPGNIHDVTDAAVVECEPYRKREGDTQEAPHTCILFANPYKSLLRVFDVTDNQFIPAPIGYFPLAVRVGVTPQYVSAAPTMKDSQAFVLDVTGNQLYRIFAKNNGNKPSFISPLREPGTPIEFLPTGMVTAKDNDKTWVLVAAGENPVIHAFSFDTHDKFDKFQIALPPEFQTIQYMAVDPSSKFLLVGDIHRTEISVFLLSSLFRDRDKATAEFSLNPKSNAGKIVAGTIDIGKGDETVALAMLKSESKALLFALDRSDKEEPVGEVSLKGLALAGYIPQGQRRNCCNNSPDAWAAVLTATGDLQYLNLKNMDSKNSNDPTNEKKIGATVSVAEKAAVASMKVGNAISIIGVERKKEDSADQTERKMFLVFSEFIASLDEGDTERIMRVDMK